MIINHLSRTIWLNPATGKIIVPKRILISFGFGVSSFGFRVPDCQELNSKPGTRNPKLALFQL
jgi:hypothetical protein